MNRSAVIIQLRHKHTRKFLPWTRLSIILVGIIYPISFIHARTYSPRRMEAARTVTEQLGQKAKMKWTKYIPVGLTWQRSLIKSDSIIACSIFSLFLITSVPAITLALPESARGSIWNVSCRRDLTDSAVRFFQSAAAEHIWQHHLAPLYRVRISRTGCFSSGRL